MKAQKSRNLASVERLALYRGFFRENVPMQFLPAGCLCYDFVSFKAFSMMGKPLHFIDGIVRDRVHFVEPATQEYLKRLRDYLPIFLELF